jgi:mannose/fructose/N-acetylgalactosamine-specific phosphotransferase system component IIC
VTHASTVALLLGAGTVAGLDLSSGPQVLLNRPLVVGTAAGLLLGDPWSGLLVGSVLELFALEVLPVGAARYPDHGPGTVGAVLAVAIAGPHELWRGVLVGLLAALAGGWSLRWMRRAGATRVARASAALQALEPGILGRLQAAGFRSDLARSAVLTTIGLGLGFAVRFVGPFPPSWNPSLNAVALGAAGGAALNGAIRNAGRGRRLAALGAGLAAGTLWAVLG